MHIVIGVIQTPCCFCKHRTILYCTLSTTFLELLLKTFSVTYNRGLTGKQVSRKNVVRIKLKPSYHRTFYDVNTYFQLLSYAIAYVSVWQFRTTIVNLFCWWTFFFALYRRNTFRQILWCACIARTMPTYKSYSFRYTLVVYIHSFMQDFLYIYAILLNVREKSAVIVIPLTLTRLNDSRSRYNNTLVP